MGKKPFTNVDCPHRSGCLRKMWTKYRAQALDCRGCIHSGSYQPISRDDIVGACALLLAIYRETTLARRLDAEILFDIVIRDQSFRCQAIEPHV